MYTEKVPPTLNDQYLSELTELTEPKDIITGIIDVYIKENLPNRTVLIQLGDHDGNNIILDPAIIADEHLRRTSGKQVHTNYGIKVQGIIEYKNLKILGLHELPITDDLQRNPFARQDAKDKFLEEHQYDYRPMDTGTGLYKKHAAK